jgi:hypothetical protein
MAAEAAIHAFDATRPDEMAFPDSVNFRFLVPANHQNAPLR